MERNYEMEIDRLHEEMEDVKRCVKQLLEMIQMRNAEGNAPEPAAEPSEGHIQKMPHMHPNKHICAILDILENSANRSGTSGRVTYLGTYESGGNQSTWVRHDVDVDPLLRQIEDRSAERVLACIGSNDRLRLLLALLRKPLTVQQMVEECGFHTTGQVYHHLRPLVAVDLVVEAGNSPRGTYAIRPHRVGGLVMLLAGIQDLLDGEYTHANYEEP